MLVASRDEVELDLAYMRLARQGSNLRTVEVWEAHEHLPWEERRKAVADILNQRKTEMSTVHSEIPDDDSDDELWEEIRNIPLGDEEEDDDNDYISRGLSHDQMLDEKMQALCKFLVALREEDKATVSSEAMDDHKVEEKAGEIGKLPGHEKKHARNEEVQLSVEGDQECKKPRVAEIFPSKGECADSGETKSPF